MTDSFPRRALVSVSNKDGLTPFVHGLSELGIEILSTGGTRRFLEQHGIRVIDISDYTGFPEIMEGRVKTLHPLVHGAILGRPDVPGDAEAIRSHGIVPFELIVCNLYPFEETIRRENVTVAEAIEQIDVGGPTMIRAAAKNHAYVGVVTCPSQYDAVLSALKTGRLNPVLRRELAAAAFEMTARYDRAITNYLTATNTSSGKEAFPELLDLDFKHKSTLRYGENPHQHAAMYVDVNAGAATLGRSVQRHGKELSFNNLLDLDAALALVREFRDPAVVVIKHNNPCGCAVADTLVDAFVNAYAGDPVSAFGSVISFNRRVDLATAEALVEPNRFVEAVIAPDYDDAAFKTLTTKPKWKASVRLMACPNMMDAPLSDRDFRRISGGLLVQTADTIPDPNDSWKVMTERQPSPEERADLEFAWIVAKHVKSNAIVYATNRAVVGVGAGQMSRLDSAHLAGHKAGTRSEGAVAASDAFFPFRDGIDEVARAGITAVIQPGGSRRDDEAITACNEHGMAMIFTERRHFRH